MVSVFIFRINRYDCICSHPVFHKTAKMSFPFADLKTEYEKDKNLQKEDVDTLLEWVKKKPHLPPINELQAILFLHSCYCSLEAAKKTVDNYFSVKTMCPDLFKDKDITANPLRNLLDIKLIAPLEKKTPDGHLLILFDLFSNNSEKFHLPSVIKLLDMVFMLQLYREGTSEGVTLLFDFSNVTMSHLLKVNPTVVKKAAYYLQEALPVRLKAIHIFNIVSFMDKVMALIKPFVKSELLGVIHLHRNVNDLIKCVPRECLPLDYGGEGRSKFVLQEKMRSDLKENTEFFQWENDLRVDEKKRLTHRNTLLDIGIDGTFRRLSID